MEPFLWAKAFDFSWTTISKILSLVFKILVIVGLPLLALWFVYASAIKPHVDPTPTSTTTVESGGTSTSSSYSIKIGFGGCARFPMIPAKK